MGEVRIKKSQIVKPSAEPTFTGSITLTEHDMLGYSIPYRSFVYFYKPVNECELSLIIDRVRDSLSSTLVHFYPFAGRLSPLGDDGSVVLQCGAAACDEGGGAVLIEAESSNEELADFGDFSDQSMFQHLIPSLDHYDRAREQMHKIPLLLVQLTSFRCGGFSLGFLRSHVVDGRSFGHFLTEWARISRGEPLEKPPFMDRSVFLRSGKPFEGLSEDNDDDIDNLGDKPGSSSAHVKEMKQESQVTKMAILPLTKTQVETLKNTAAAAAIVNDDDASNSNSQIRPYSRYEVITAHIWRCLCKAKEYGEDSVLQTKTVIVADVRGRVQPPLPPEYFGNGLTRVTATCLAGQIVSNQLAFTCQKMRDAINRVTHEYIQSDIEHLRRLRLSAGEVIRRKSDGSMLKVDLMVTNWLYLPFYGLDFAWGKEICMRPGPSNFNGGVTIMRGQDHEDEGLINVVICLPEAHMDKFKKFFYQVDIII